MAHSDNRPSSGGFLLTGRMNPTQNWLQLSVMPQAPFASFSFLLDLWFCSKSSLHPLVVDLKKRFLLVSLCGRPSHSLLSPSSHHRHTTTVVSVLQPGDKWREKSGSGPLDVDEELGALDGDQPGKSGASSLSPPRLSGPCLPKW